MEDLTIEELEAKREELFDQRRLVENAIVNKFKNQLINKVKKDTYWKRYDTHYYHILNVEFIEDRMNVKGERFMFNNSNYSLPDIGNLVSFEDYYYYEDFPLEECTKEEYDTQYEKLTKALNYINSL